MARRWHCNEKTFQSSLALLGPHAFSSVKKNPSTSYVLCSGWRPTTMHRHPENESCIFSLLKKKRVRKEQQMEIKGRRKKLFGSLIHTLIMYQWIHALVCGLYPRAFFTNYVWSVPGKGLYFSTFNLVKLGVTKTTQFRFTCALLFLIQCQTFNKF